MTLFEYIMEAAGFSTLLDNTDDVYKTLLKCGYKIDREFCEDIFKIWRTEFNSSERHLPFRINTAKKTCKLARCYFRDNLIKELTSICNKYGYDIVINAKSLHTIKIGNKSIQEGDGSVFGNRANRGLGFETELQTYIINYIKNGPDPEDKSGINIDSLVKSGALDEVIKIYKDRPDVDLTTLVKLTGASNSKRNKKGQIIDKETFKINTTNTQDVINDSGEKIADITIGKDCFISVKMKEAQLTGITAREVFDHNNTFKSAIEGGLTFEEIEDDKNMIPFINFATQFGLNPRELYNMYLNRTFGDLNIYKYDGRVLGIFIQKLIGGNYWYINDSGTCFFVSDKPKNLNVEITSANVSNSGQGICFKCSINGKVNGKIWMRTDGNGKYPYRIFPQFKVKEINEL